MDSTIEGVTASRTIIQWVVWSMRDDLSLVSHDEQVASTSSSSEVGSAVRSGSLVASTTPRTRVTITEKKIPHGILAEPGTQATSADAIGSLVGEGSLPKPRSDHGVQNGSQERTSTSPRSFQKISGRTHQTRREAYHLLQVSPELREASIPRI